jgi:alkylation response protein AidB-like acyl-CoA dehydrogenase
LETQQNRQKSVMNSELLSAEERQVIDTVARFILKGVIPNVSQLERESGYPDFIVNQMKELGLFGIAVSQEYGGFGPARGEGWGAVEFVQWGPAFLLNPAYSLRAGTLPA